MTAIMPEPTIADIMRELGGLSADAGNARESRRVMHDKQDAMAEQQSEISSKVDVVHEIAQQARANAGAALQNIHRFESEFHEIHVPAIAAAAQTAQSVAKFQSNAEPMIAFMRLVRSIIMWMVTGGAVGLLAAVAAILYAREQFGAFLRLMLGL